MLTIIIAAVLAAAVAGFLIKFILDKNDTPAEITWKEFAIGITVALFLIAPGVTKVGWNMAKKSKVIYNEYWNGWELRAIKSDITCTRDGACGYEYDCDPYIVMVSYSCNCDSKGNCSTCFRPETRYHSCPYVTVESNYSIQTTLGLYNISNNRFPENPQAHRWRRSEPIPDYVIQRAGVGAPDFWMNTKIRIDSGTPGPVTKRAKYDNFILASDRTILKQYSGEIERFKKAGLMPLLERNVADFYYANKVYFVGYHPANASDWETHMAYLDAALGTELQGDMHLVLVQNQTISNNPDSYVLALKAYWQNTKAFGKDSLSKNGIVVVCGTSDGKAVTWARAFTGMPLGNEAMTVSIQNRLKGVAMTPEDVIGTVISKFNGGSRVLGLHGNGVVENTLWGLKDPATKFKRFSMTGKTGVGSGFKYLMSEIEPNPNQKIWIIVVTFFACCIVWLVAALVGERTYKQRYPDYWRR